VPTGRDPRLRTAARARLRAVKAIDQPPCWRCGQPIDYQADPNRDPAGYHLDEIIAREHGGDPLDPDNTAPAHNKCNTQAGARSTNLKRAATKAPKVDQPSNQVPDPKPRTITAW
jgi:5-methylcytosine-specific restriction endonuclease McrA